LIFCQNYTQHTQTCQGGNGERGTGNGEEGTGNREM
jgi:hypothetical protein